MEDVRGAVADGCGASHRSGRLVESIEKLDGASNYATWKVQVELYLVMEDLWDFIEKTPSTAVGLKMDKKVRAKMLLMVKPHCLVHVKKATTAKESWGALKAAFEDQGINNRCRLLGRLVSQKLSMYSSPRVYVNEILSLANQLADMDKEVDDELLAALMLQGLGEQYEPMRMAIENSNITLTTDYVKTKLLQIDVTSTNEDSSQNALSAAKKKSYWKANEKGKGKIANKKIECYVCGEGHKARFCPKKHYNHAHTTHTALHTYRNFSQEWILDSGASFHMTNRRDWLNNYERLNEPVQISCANGNRVEGEGRGDVCSDELNVSVKGAIFVPKLATNLLSVSTLVNRNFVVVFSKRGCELYKSEECQVNGKVELVCKEEKGIYLVKSNFNPHMFSALKTKVDDEVQLWHRRLGHLGLANMKILRDKLARGISFKDPDSVQCVSCLKGKQTTLPFPKQKSTRATELLELVHSDVCGPIETASFAGYKYFLTFIDDKSRNTFVYFLRNKSEVFSKLVEFKTLVEKQTGKKLKAIRTDNGTEYVNERVNNFLRGNGITHQLTVEYTPQQNGVSERANRSIVERARSMLEEAKLDKKYWAEAVNTSVYLKNRCPTRAVKGMTPEEAWSKKRVDLRHLKVFGCRAFMHVPKQKRKKFDSKTKELLFVGYCETTKGYRLLDPVTHRLYKARDVVFFENQVKIHANDTDEIVEMMPSDEVRERPLMIQEVNAPHEARQVEQHEDQQENDEFFECEEVEVPESELQDSNSSEHRLENTCEQQCVENTVEGVDVSETEVQGSGGPVLECENTHDIPERRYPLRERKLRNFDDYLLYYAEEDIKEDPTTIEEALSRVDKDKWHKAIQEELNALKKNKTWELVEKANGYCIDSKWIFRIKKEPGKIRYKARLVARGFSQIKGVNYNETFAPVIRHSTLRLLLALAVENNLKVDQMDVVTAFLNGDLKEKVYLKQPKGFEEKGKEGHVCLLKKAIYGLKQAPRAWYEKLNKVLLDIGFKRCETEPCVYRRKKHDCMMIIAVYVDDILIFWNNEKERIELKKELQRKFEMKDLGEVDVFLGMKIKCQDNSIQLNQTEYLERILKKFGMSSCKSVKTPVESGIKLVKPQDKNYIPPIELPYRELIGSLMYLAVCSRPDISYAVSYLSQFNSCYDKTHWAAAKRVLRYLNATKEFGLTFKKTGNKLVGYVDADHAGDVCDRKSYTGFVFTLGGGPIAWESRKQTTVALSSAESEYVALSEGCRESAFLTALLAELTGINEVVELLSDSQSAIQIAENPMHHRRTKHIDVRHHYIREMVRMGKVRLSYLPTNEMPADVFTKGLSREKHERCMKGMQL